jgi:hypothetical protein
MNNQNIFQKGNYAAKSSVTISHPSDPEIVPEIIIDSKVSAVIKEIEDIRTAQIDL